MALKLLTYFQINVFFLDYLFLFGRKLNHRNSQPSSIRHRTCAPGAEEPRSPRIEMTYDLHGVERDSSEGRPWSIRRTVAHYQTDLGSGRSTYLFVKGNDLIKARIGEALDQEHFPKPRHGDGPRAISQNLQVHALVSNWSVEGWRWYLDYVEEKLHELSEQALQQPVAFTPFRETKASEDPTDTNRPQGMSWPWVWIRSSLVWLLRREFIRRSEPDKSVEKAPITTFYDDLPLKQPPPPPIELGPTGGISGPSFEFEHLQKLQKIEEETSQIVSVIKGNLEVVTGLCAYYKAKPWHDHLASTITHIKGLQNDLDSFEEKMLGAQRNLRMHQTRAETLLRLATDRKQLVSLQMLSILPADVL